MSHLRFWDFTKRTYISIVPMHTPVALTFALGNLRLFPRNHCQSCIKGHACSEIASNVFTCTCPIDCRPLTVTNYVVAPALRKNSTTLVFPDEIDGRPFRSFASLLAEVFTNNSTNYLGMPVITDGRPSTLILRLAQLATTSRPF